MTSYKGYDVLNAMPADAFLNPDNFRTGFDTPALASEQYEKGKKIGTEYKEVHISASSTWGANKPNTALSSYEGIGYHAGTADLLKGFLDSGVAIFVHRWDGNKLTETKIK